MSLTVVEQSSLLCSPGGVESGRNCLDFFVTMVLAFCVAWFFSPACRAESICIGGKPVFDYEPAVGRPSSSIQSNLDNALTACTDRSPSAVCIVYVKGLPVITLGGYQVVTVNVESARKSGQTPALLAQRWADSIRQVLQDKDLVQSYVSKIVGEPPTSRIAPQNISNDSGQPSESTRATAKLDENQSRYNKHAVSMYNLGVTAYQQNSPESAIIFFKRAADIDPTLIEAHYNLARLYQQQRRFAEARRRYEEVLKLNSDDADAQRHLTELGGAPSSTNQNSSRPQGEVSAAPPPTTSATATPLDGAGKTSGDAIVSASPSLSTQSVVLSPGKNRPVTDKWALIVGISNFARPAYNLRFAAKDALDFYNYLVTECGFAKDHVKVLLNESATRQNIMSAFGSSWLPKVCMPDDMVVVFMSTHGTPSSRDAGKKNYIVAYDTDRDELFGSGVNMNDLCSQIKERVKTDRLLIVMDTCFSGGAGTGAKGEETAASIDAKAIALGTGRLVLSSSDSEQRSWESKSKQNGIFTYNLLDVLRKNGGNVIESFPRLKRSVEWEAKTTCDADQSPILAGQWEGEKLILTVPASEPRTLPQNLIPPPPAMAISSLDSAQRNGRVASASVPVPSVTVPASPGPFHSTNATPASTHRQNVPQGSRLNAADSRLVSTYLKIADEKMAKGKDSEALEFYQKVNKIAPNALACERSSDILNRLGYVELAIEQLRSAVKAGNGAGSIELNKKMASLLGSAGKQLLDKGDSKTGHEYLREAQSFAEKTVPRLSLRDVSVKYDAAKGVFHASGEVLNPTEIQINQLKIRADIVDTKTSLVLWSKVQLVVDEFSRPMNGHETRPFNVVGPCQSGDGNIELKIYIENKYYGSYAIKD